MKHFLKCLTIVALVVVVATIATAPPALTTASHKPTPAAAIREGIDVAKTPPPTKTAAPATVNSATPGAVTPAPVAAAPVYPAGCENYLPIVQQYDWNVDMAMAIMQAENHSCNPSIDNAGLNRDGSVDYGLFQVNSIHADMVGGNLESLRTPSVNIAIAYSLSHHGTNWTAWSTYKNGAYLSYLK